MAVKKILTGEIEKRIIGQFTNMIEEKQQKIAGIMYNHIEIERNLIAMIRIEKKDDEKFKKVLEEMGYREASRVCLLLEIIDKSTYDDLMTFNKIRNKVAHGIKMRDKADFEKKKMMGIDLDVKILRQRILSDPEMIRIRDELIAKQKKESV